MRQKIVRVFVARAKNVSGRPRGVVLPLLVSTRLHMTQVVAAGVLLCPARVLGSLHVGSTMFYKKLNNVSSEYDKYDTRRAPTAVSEANACLLGSAPDANKGQIHLPSEMLLYPRQGGNVLPPPVENAPHRRLGDMARSRQLVRGVIPAEFLFAGVSVSFTESKVPTRAPFDTLRSIKNNSTV